MQNVLWGLAAALIAIGIAGKCRADEPLPMHAMCRVICGPLSDGSYYNGSGTLIDVNGRSEGLIVTNAHVIRDTPRGPFQVKFADGVTHGAVLVQADAELDLAALKIDQVQRRPARWAAALDGQKFRTAGFGGDGRLMYMWGSLIAYERAGASGGRKCFTFSAPSRHGDSGGAVFNSRGEVCGVRWATSYDVPPGQESPDTIAVHPEHLAEFLGRLGIRPSGRTAIGSEQADRATLAAGVWQPAPRAYSQQYSSCPGGVCGNAGSAGVWIGVQRRQPQLPPGGIYAPDSVERQPPAAAPAAAAKPCECGPRLDAIDKSLADLRGELSTLAKRDELAGYLKREEAGQHVPDLSEYVRRDQLAALEAAKDQQIAELQQETVVQAEERQSLLERLKSIAATAKAAGEVAIAAKNEAASGAGGLFAGWHWGLQLAALLGMSGTPAGLLAVAGTIAYRRLKKRLAKRAGAGGRPQEASFQ